MLRPVLAGLAMSALTTALYALWCFFVPRQWGLGADAWDVLLLVGVMLSAMGFFAAFEVSNLDRRLHERMAEIDDRNRRCSESARANALRLNAYVHEEVGCTDTTDAVVAGSAIGAQVIPFPASGRGTRPHRASCLRPLAAN